MFVFTILSSSFFFFSFVRVHVCVSSMPLVSWFLQLELHGSPLESHTSQGRLWNGKLRVSLVQLFKKVHNEKVEF